MPRNKNPNPFVRGRRVSAGKQGDTAAENAIVLAKDAKAFGLDKEAFIAFAAKDEQDKGPLRRACTALGL